MISTKRFRAGYSALLDPCVQSGQNSPASGFRKGKGEGNLQQMFPCPGCGAQISIGQRVCKTCGEKFQYRCAHCGANVETVSEFCTNCGEGLYRQTHLTEPLPYGAITYKDQQRAYGYRGGRPQPKKTNGRLGAFLGSMAIMVCIVAVFCAVVIGSQGKASEVPHGGFSFKEIPPASTQPPSTELEPEPVLVADLPECTADEVIMLAKSFSPDCRVLTSEGT